MQSPPSTSTAGMGLGIGHAGTSRTKDTSLTFVLHSQLTASQCSFHLNSLQLPCSSTSATATTTTSLISNPVSRHTGLNQVTPSDLYCKLQLFADNNPISLPMQSQHKSFKSKSLYAWNQPIIFPLNYCDLPLSAQLVITVYDIAGPRQIAIVGGTTLRLFGKKGTLRKGKQRCYVWRGREADGSATSETPSKLGTKDEMGKLEKLVKLHERGDLTRMDWLDKLAFRQTEKLHATESDKSDNMFLYIDMPRFDFPVVFSEAEYTIASSASFLPSTSVSTPNYRITADAADLFTILDPEIVRDNPVEAKHRRLVRSHRNGPLDRELKPNAKIRDDLNDILRYPPTRALTGLQRDLIWQFRFYLTRDKRALTKFLKSVVWSDPGEVKQAVETLLPMWAEVDMDDALELLGPGEGFRDRRVRGYAVAQLDKADDDELMLYLLQLVQALKFESQASPSSSRSPPGSIRSSGHATSASMLNFQPLSTSIDDLPSLEDFLVTRAGRNPILGNHFYWYISVESEDKQTGKMYRAISDKFKQVVKDLHVDGQPDQLDLLRRQTEFIVKISQLAKDLRLLKESRPKKIERLLSTLRDSKSHLGSFQPIPLPLDARRLVVGIDADKSSIFKSNLFPLRLHLLCDDGSEYPVIFKNGDDLRQDQLVIQLFTLMDRLLRKENLDLKLMPYRVLATGAIDGMVQFVDGRTLADISSEYGGSLLNFMRSYHPDPGSVGTFGVDPVVLDTYIRSCAGYCVVTYLLGVGDRHLDNLLLSADGHFFHVDFGYILGRDPKPFPPAVKVCKEMVDAMGGVSSMHYARFKNLCFTAFTSLRKNSNLIINLVALMVQANIPDIKLEPDKAVIKVQDKFLLNLSEEDAIKVFEALLNETSYFTSVLDVIHSVAQYYRA